MIKLIYFHLGDDTPTVSSGIERLRQLLQVGEDSAPGSISIYARAANGSLPVVVQAFNEVSHGHAFAPFKTPFERTDSIMSG